MSALDTLLAFLPIITFALFLIAAYFKKLANVVLFLGFMVLTLIIGVFSISSISPLSASPLGLSGLVTNMLVFLYVAAVIYGGYFGAYIRNYERMIVSLIIVTFISLVSAVI